MVVTSYDWDCLLSRAKHVRNLTDQICKGRPKKVSNIVLERNVGIVQAMSSFGQDLGGGGYDLDGWKT